MYRVAISLFTLLPMILTLLFGTFYPAAHSRPSQGAALSAEHMRTAPQETNYCRQVAHATLIAQKLTGTNQTETARRIYEYFIEHVSFAPPVGFDIWRYRSYQSEPPSFVENRSLSPLLFFTGSCEDFSAAMVLLLEAAGIPAYYVAGYTLSASGGYTDHAWVVAQIDGAWYHLDAQLEQNVTGSLLTYRFFMRPDEYMRRDHLWGENLLEYVGGKATKEEVSRIRQEFTPPICETLGPSIKPHPVRLPKRPDVRAIERRLEEERRVRGPLPPLPLHIEPPVLVAAQPLVDSTPK